MKSKALVLVVILIMAVSGCAFLKTAQTQACNPPAAVIAVAQAAAPIVALAINMLLPGSVAYVNAVTAMQAVDAILGGACVSLTQLNALIAWLQSDETQMVQAKMMAKVGPMKAKAINVGPLQEWAKTIK